MRNSEQSHARRRNASALVLALAAGFAFHLPAANAVEGRDGITVTADSKLALTDIRWLEKASQAGAAEVAAGKLAAQQAVSQDVRHFGSTMVEHHAKANEELKNLAEARGAVLPDKPDSAHQDEMKKLVDLKGRDFDREYMAYAGSKDHEDAAKLFQDGIDNLKDPALRAYAQKTLPVIRLHFETAREIRQKM